MRTFKRLTIVSWFRDPCVVQRFANRLYRRNIPFIPTVLDLWLRLHFSCWFPHTVRTGDNCTLGYGGLGCIIHGESVLGNRVHIGANVLIGGNAREYGVPKIGNDVYIGFGAVLIGPIEVGNDSVIGANSVVTRDVPSCCVVAGNPARVIKTAISHTYLLTGAQKAD